MNPLKLLLMALALVFEMASFSFAASYTITNLGTLGGTRTYGENVNSLGQVAGVGYNAGDADFRATYYDGVLHDLGALGGTRSEALDINDSGKVVGIAYTPGNSVWHAFLYDGTMHDLFGAAGGPFSEADGINASGQIAATVNNQAVLYDGSMHFLGSLGGSGGAAIGLNEAGHVVGYAGTPGGAIHAFLYDGSMHDLSTLGGTNSVGFRVNAANQVAGWSNMPNGDQHAIFYNGTLHDIGTLGGTISIGYAISPGGQVLGGAYLPGDVESHAFIYDLVHGLTDLNTLISPTSGWDLQEAHGINSAGQITGVGVFGGQTRAFLLTPVPEPSSATLAAGAVATIVVLWRQGRRSRPPAEGRG